MLLTLAPAMSWLNAAREAARRRRLVKSLDLTCGLDLDRLRRQVEERRGTTIHLIGLDGGPALPCGLWLSRDDGVDFVFYDVGAGEVHRCHIVLHEFAHMLLGHVGAAPLTGLDGIVGHLAPHTVARMLRRAVTDSAAERAAERLAMAIARRARRLSSCGHRTVDPRIERLECALGDRTLH